LRLLGSPFLQLGHDAGRQGNVASSAPFRLFVTDPSLGLLGALDDRKGCLIEVDSTPAHGGNLAAPQAADSCQQGSDEYPVVSYSRDSRGRLRHVVDQHLPPLEGRSKDVPPNSQTP
jgi:hypothetical protein